jgi:hypothetical protein
MHLNGILTESTDAALLDDPWKLKGLKYTLVEIAEAMANTLQHILAKNMGDSMSSFSPSRIISRRPAHLCDFIVPGDNNLLRYIFVHNRE